MLEKMWKWYLGFGSSKSKVVKSSFKVIAFAVASSSSAGRSVWPGKKQITQVLYTYCVLNEKWLEEKQVIQTMKVLL